MSLTQDWWEGKLMLTQWKHLPKFNLHESFDPASPPLGIHTRDNPTRGPSDKTTRTQRLSLQCCWKPPNCPSAGSRVGCWWSIHPRRWYAPTQTERGSFICRNAVIPKTNQCMKKARIAFIASHHLCVRRTYYFLI